MTDDSRISGHVLLDMMTDDPRWFAWSAGAIERAADSSRLVINAVIYAEVSIRYSRIEDLEAALPRPRFDREARGSRPSRSRISAGMVTCPLDVIRIAITLTCKSKNKGPLRATPPRGFWAVSVSRNWRVIRAWRFHPGMLVFGMKDRMVKVVLNPKLESRIPVATLQRARQAEQQFR